MQEGVQMRSIRTRLLAAAILTLAACSPPAAQQAAQAPQAPQAETAQPTGKPTGDQSAVNVGGAPTPAMLIGRWGDNGDCTKDIVFNADGTFLSYTGGVGQWRLDGDRMTMSGAGGTFVVQVQVINGSQLMITNPDGSVGTSQRC